MIDRLQSRFIDVDKAFIQVAVDSADLSEKDAAAWLTSQLSLLQNSSSKDNFSTPLCSIALDANHGDDDSGVVVSAAKIHVTFKTNDDDDDDDSDDKTNRDDDCADVNNVASRHLLPPDQLSLTSSKSSTSTSVLATPTPNRCRDSPLLASEDLDEPFVAKRRRVAELTPAISSSLPVRNVDDGDASFALSPIASAAPLALPMCLTMLPATVLWQIIALWHDVYDVPRSTLMLVCRAFRLNLRLWTGFVRVNLAQLCDSDASDVQQYANVVANNDVHGVFTTTQSTRTHALATLLRDARRIEFVNGSALADELLIALATLKGVSRCQRDLLCDVTFPGTRRRPVRAVDHSRCTGADVGPLCGLALDSCAVSDHALATLGSRCAASLETFECRRAERVSGAFVRRWCEQQYRWPRLYYLLFEHCPNLGAVHFERLGALRALEHLSLRQCASVGEPVMMAQIATLPLLKTLALSLASGTSDRSLQVLFEAQPRSLRSIDTLGNTAVTFDGLYDCVRIAGIERINARFVTPLDNEDVRILQEVARQNKVELLLSEEEVPRSSLDPSDNLVVDEDQLSMINDERFGDDDDVSEFFRQQDDDIFHSE